MLQATISCHVSFCVLCSRDLCPKFTARSLGLRTRGVLLNLQTHLAKNTMRQQIQKLAKLEPTCDYGLVSHILDMSWPPQLTTKMIMLSLMT